MKIVDVEVTMVRLPEIRLVGDGCQTLALIRVHTDEGIVGVGEVHTNPLVSKAIIDAPICAKYARGLREIVVGENPLEIQRLWDKMYRFSTTFGRRGAVIHAISGIDIALWDIAGKAAGVPVHQMLGGARRRSFDCYASDLSPDSPEAPVEIGQRHRSNGYRAMKFGWGGLGGDVRADVRNAHQLRAALGDDVELMLDMGMPVSLDDSIYLGEALREPRYYFLEEPLDPRDLPNFARLVARSPTPIASGEKEDTLEPYLQLMDQGGLRIIQPDVTRVGGITEMMRIVSAAEARGVRVIPHCWSCDILVAATMQVLAVKRDAEFLEFNVMDQPIRRGVITEPFKPVDGRLELSDAPGLGVEIDEDLIRRYHWEG
jgi:L-alanine-DL-glutamate epimerase-like enolase superfamily enzyme